VVRIWLILYMVIPIQVGAQRSGSDIAYINEQILFINESVHGFLIAHRVYENFNQSINEYVDLPSHEINKYGNKDLPMDIFDDPEQWFYQRSPQSLYKELLMDARRDQNLDTWPLIANIRNTADIINQRRLTIEQAIQNEQIHEMANVQSVYERLEESVEHYDRIGNSVSAYEEQLLANYLDIELPEKEKAVYTAIVELHFDIKRCLRSLKDEHRGGVIQSNSKIQKELNWLTACINELTDQKTQSKLLRIRDQFLAISKNIKASLAAIPIPAAYETLGREYYYHNVKLLTLLNRYGNGYVSTANKFFDDAGWAVIHLIEEPHYLKVTYPKRITKEVLLDKNIDPELDVAALELPELPALEEIVVSRDTVAAEKIKSEIPPVVIASHILIVDSLSFELELYDHRTKDGDLVSINVNGEWMFNNISLEKEIQRIKLSIKPGVPNVIRIRAENTGWMPPNTVGIKYRSKSGRAENQFIKQDLYENQVLEIKYKAG